MEEDLDHSDRYQQRQGKVRGELSELERLEKEWLRKRSRMPSRIKIGEMPKDIRYAKLHTESKRFQDIIKMICYRAETFFANLLFPGFKKSAEEKRYHQITGRHHPR